MPNRNATGPSGLGPRTGRGMGPCNNYCSGCGRRLCFARQSSSQPTPTTLSLSEHKKLLEDELAAVKADLAIVNKALDDNQPGPGKDQA